MRICHLSLMLLVGASSAIAQTPDRVGAGNPALAPPLGQKEDARARDAGRLNDADKLFIREAALNAIAMTETAKLSRQKHAGAGVIQFGERMMQDRAALDQKLAAISVDAALSPPAALDKERAAMLDHLRNLEGAAFDRQFWAYQLAEYQKAAQLSIHEIGSGSNPALKGVASEALPIIFQRLRQCQTATMAGAGTQ